MANDSWNLGTASSISPAEGESKNLMDGALGKLLIGAAAALLSMAIFIVWVGTLAQVDKDMWEVIDDYFRSWWCWVEWKVFFPPSFFPSLADYRWDRLAVTGFPFPGGAAIGSGLFVLLGAVCALRFRIRASGVRLWAGLAVTVVGALLAGLVIQSGHSRQGLQGLPLFGWDTLWRLMQLCLAGGWLLAAYSLVKAVHALRTGRRGTLEAGVLALVVVTLGGLLGWMLLKGDRLNDPSMRILWQLTQGGLAGVVLLAGCWLLFRNQAGGVLLHGGVGLMMFGELFVSLYAVEQQMTIAEGETVGFTTDIRSTELAIIDPSPPDHDNVVVIPAATNGKATRFADGGPIEDERLPFDVKIVEYFKNSGLFDATPDVENPATAGVGLHLIARPMAAAVGVKGGQVDLAAAYVQFLRKGSGDSLGVYLCSQALAAQHLADKVSVDDKTYDVQLRFRRSYKPYSIHLKDVRKDDYLGTSTARNYSSDVRLRDPSRNVDLETRIWMNNPLRYAGETFYQSGYDKRNGRETTDLQVVKNTGWMIPYVACMILSVGMLSHFFATLLRFLKWRQASLSPGEAVSSAAAPAAPTNRQQRPADSGRPPASSVRPRASAEEKSAGASVPRDRARPRGAWPMGSDASRRLLPIAMVAVCALWVGRRAMPLRTPDSAMKLEEFGKLPLVYRGRMQPFDTLARNSLQIVSGKQTFRDDPVEKRSAVRRMLRVIRNRLRIVFGEQPVEGESGQKQPAIRWFLDVITDSAAAERHKVFRIDSLDVLGQLGLTPRKGFRYALAEFRPKAAELEQKIEEARQRNAEQLEFQQKKLLELGRRIHAYTLLSAAFRPLEFPPFPSEQEIKQKRGEAMEAMVRIRELLEMMPDSKRELASLEPPLAVPFDSSKEPWQAYATARNRAYVEQIQKHKVNPATLALGAVLDAYAAGDVGAFNRATAQYQRLLEEHPPAGFDPLKIRFEAYFNHVAPFYHAAWLYGVALVLAALGWLAKPRVFNRAAFWLVVLALAIHTFALLARMYISGRPPVTNLYSSAVFIGWGCVVLGLVLEVIFRLGIGNVIAAISGVVTLIIAHYLSLDGDTITVLLAVLDTQFWLATHVVTITLGYSTTFLAGLLGVLYVLRGVATPSLSAAEGKEFGRMIYGAICFATFFSLLGTVLGGLWADDSWGRFWGWDPKENGALIIVLWNAVVLHLYGARFVEERGLALLAVVGNIVTSWSWFGVNELGVGLHSYGFTEGVLRTLGLFVLSQLAIILLGGLPKRFWWSFRRRAAARAG